MTEEKKQEKSKALDLAVTQIERQFGKGAIMKLGKAISGVKEIDKAYKKSLY